MADRRSDGRGGVLRSGHVDSRPADAAGRAATTAPGAIAPAGFERNPRHVANQRAADFVRRTVSVSGFNDIRAAFRCRLRRVRQRQDRCQVQHGALSRRRHERQRVRRNNPANRIVSTVSRGWTDNSSKVVDCNLLNFAAQTPTTPGSGGDTCNVLGQRPQRRNLGQPSRRSTRIR